MTLLAVVAIPLAIAIIGWKILDWIDDMHDYAERYRDPFSEQLDEIRGLPEVPYDWEREDAA